MKIVSRSEERSDERGRQFSLAQIISIIPSFGWDNSIIIFAFIRPDSDNFYYSFSIDCFATLHYSALLNFVWNRVKCEVNWNYESKRKRTEVNWFIFWTLTSYERIYYRGFENLSKRSKSSTKRKTESNRDRSVTHGLLNPSILERGLWGRF